MSCPDDRPVTAAERARYRARAALADDAPDVLDRVRSELDALVARAQDAGYVVPLAWLTQVNRHLDDLGDLLTRPDGPPDDPPDDPDRAAPAEAFHRHRTGGIRRAAEAEPAEELS